MDSDTTTTTTTTNGVDERESDSVRRTFVDGHCAFFEGIRELAYTNAHREIYNEYVSLPKEENVHFDDTTFESFACNMSKRGAELDGDDDLVAYYAGLLTTLRSTRSCDPTLPKDNVETKIGARHESEERNDDDHQHHQQHDREKDQTTTRGESTPEADEEEEEEEVSSLSDDVDHELFELIAYCDVDAETRQMVIDYVNGNLVEASTARDSHGNSILMAAVQYNVVALVRFLATRVGMSTTSINKEGCTPLHYACSGDVARILMENGGASALEVCELGYGCTALHFAAQCADADVLRVLIDAGANLKARDFQGYRAIDYATEACLDTNAKLLTAAMAHVAKAKFRMRSASGNLSSSGGAGGGDKDRGVSTTFSSASLQEVTAAAVRQKTVDKEDKVGAADDGNTRTSIADEKDPKRYTEKDLEEKIRSAVDEALRSARSKWKAKETTYLAKIETVTNAKERLLVKFAKEQKLRRSLHNELEEVKGNIRVYCRIRPLSKSELSKKCTVTLRAVDEYMLSLDFKKRSHSFEFDRVFGPDVTQASVFEPTKRLCQSVIDGYNVCIYCYGQTGSGKTYTMIGDGQDVTEGGDGLGIAPRVSSELFRIAATASDDDKWSFQFRMSLYEVYRENLLDLMRPPDDESRAKLSVQLDNDGRVQVIGGTIVDVSSSSDLMSALKKGMSSRKTAETKMNKTSSRSHLVFIIFVHASNRVTGQTSNGKLTLCDLAGSERANKTGAEGDRMKEAQAINKSLSSLGSVISALTSAAPHVPYRNSVLTQLMRDCLGGNAKTLMFVNVSPADYNASEGFSSLNFAKRCKKIENKAVAAIESKQLRFLKDQLNRLRMKSPSGKGAPRISPKKSGRFLIQRPHGGKH